MTVPRKNIPGRPKCCGQPMQAQGRTKSGKQRFKCNICKAWNWNPPWECLRLIKLNSRWSSCHGVEGYPIHQGDRGRWIVQLPSHRLPNGKHVPHRFANSSGWQYVYRFLVADALGRKLATDEHVHHLEKAEAYEVLENNLDLKLLELVLAEYHGRLHAWQTLLASPSQLSQHLESHQPNNTIPAQRWKAIIGPAAELEGSGRI